MAYVVKDLASFRVNRRVGEDEIMMCPVDPGLTTIPGSRYVVSNGVLALAGDSDATPHFAADTARVVPANTQAFVRPDKVYGPGQQAKDLTLVPFRTLAAAGTLIEIAKIANYEDETVTSWVNGTRTMVVGTGFNTNDYANGALAYIYEGPGQGEVNIVEDYVHSSLSVIFHRPFDATPTTDTKIIFLNPAAAQQAVAIFGRGDLDNASAFDCEDGVDDGDYMVYADWQMLGAHFKNGHLPVVRTGALNRV